MKSNEQTQNNKPAWDACWLTNAGQNKFSTAYVDPNISPAVKDIVAEEVTGSFGAEVILQDEAALSLRLVSGIPQEGYRIHKKGEKAEVVASDEGGLLYGLYALIRRLSCAKVAKEEDFIEESAPKNHVRMLNHWDNLMGDIERGYAGRSIFYEEKKWLDDWQRYKDYARLLASIGINAISINNVNVKREAAALLVQPHLSKVKELAELFAPYGIRLYLSVNFASPIIVGGLATADPLSDEVQAWWSQTAKAIYAEIPSFGGFVVKADSEGEPGPYSYGRDHADGANMFAKALQPYNGTVIWRCFVYNCRQDWRDRTTDRARSAYDTFKPLDGRFMENVILQTKFGPIDFQIREPLSPLFGAMEHTNMTIEMQITQEYTGHQLHICYLVPQWKEMLDFDTYAHGKGSTTAKMLAEKSMNGIAAVGSVGRDENWTGHKLAQANWYGFGRLCWDPTLSSEEILREWIRQTFQISDEKEQIMVDIMLNSSHTYEKYTVPLGIGFMCQPNHHYGPSVDGYEYDRWGTYHFADRDGVGVDRTKATGTGYASLYFSPNAEKFENVASCPDELLLFFHHVPYTHILHSGKTLIQHIYDTHFEGYDEAEQMAEKWKTLEGSIAEVDYANVCERLEEQLRCAREWRDQVNTYFYRKSGIADQKGRRVYP